MTSPCPDDRIYSQLLSNELASSTVELIETHLGNCDDCRNRLDRISNSAPLNEWIGDWEAANLPPSMPNRIGRYRIQSEIGRGGMGIIYKSWDEDLQRTVAIKILRIGRDDVTNLERFIRESRAAGKVSCEYLIPVLDVIQTDDGRPAIVMPLIDGPTLRDQIRSEIAISPRQSTEVIRQIAIGLKAIHAAGLIHRDVKPANILLDRTDGRAKLGDFGLTRELEQGNTLTRDHIVVGTPEYLAPEASQGENSCDSRSDLYSLGITLYECLTGIVPFRGSPFEILAQHRDRDPVPLRSLNASIPADLETICLKCLAKQPDSRYQSAQELIDDLDRYLNQRPILARPVGRVERMVKWCRRNPWPVALMVVATVGIIVSSLGWRQSNKNFFLAKEREREARDHSDRAVERSLLALDAINTLIIKAQNLAGNTPGTLNLKKQLSEAALEDLRRLSATVDQLPGIERSTILARQKLGETFHSLGQSDDALNQWNLVCNLCQQKVDHHPNDFDALRDLAKAQCSIGSMLLRKPDLPGAKARANEAIRLLGTIPESDRNRRDHFEVYASANRVLGDAEMNLNQIRDAIEHFQISIDAFQNVSRMSPGDSTVLGNLLYMQGRIGYVEISSIHDYTSAESRFRDQLSIIRVQRKLQPNDPDWQRRELVACLDLSSALQRKCNYDEALDLAKRTIEPFTKTATLEPGNGLAQRDLSVAWNTLGHAQLGLKNYAEADVSFAKSLTILRAFAANHSQAAIVASDIPLGEMYRSYSLFRNNRIAESAEAIGRFRDAFVENVKTVWSPLQIAMFKKTIQTRIDAAQTVAKIKVDDPTPIFNSLDRETALYAISLYIGNQIIKGNMVQAGKVLDACEPSQRKSLPIRIVEASYENALAEQANKPEVREKHLELGKNLLVDAIRQDRGILETLYLVPELNSIRASQTFQLQIKQLCAAK
ncbi:MAG: protein kinase [Gemmataceae bacterium]